MTQPRTNPSPSDSDTPPRALAGRDLTGAVLGDFRVERLLGRGGMGEVYLARQVSLDRPVAMKVLKPELLSNPTYLARFESEAWAAARLNHPNIVHIYTVGTLEGVRFIAMEYVHGTNLREFIQKRGAPELPLALSIMKQATQAVGAAGEVGLIHRDIKPDNLLITKKGQVKVADFGLVRGPGSEQLNLTQPGVTLGTPMYMSPEQVQGRPMDHRSDLYSLGVTFYHMLAAAPPFRAETGLALALKHVNEQPVSLAIHRPDLPAELVALVMKLMAKDPAERYQSAAEVLRDLARVREKVQATTGAVRLPESGLTTALAPPAPPPRPSQADAPTRPDRPEPAERAPRRIGIGTILLIGLAGLVGGGALGWLARADDLLRPDAVAPAGPPAVWMADWSRIPRQPSPAAQYRYAQTRAPETYREAAWLAVPGYYPTSHDWASRSYTQLARALLRRGDAAGLESLAADLGRTDRERDQDLATIARAAAAAAREEAGEVRSRVGSLKPLALDPGLAELALEAIDRARRAGSTNGADRDSLDRIRTQLLINLQIEPLILVDERLAGPEARDR